jgi:hypothetical protein
MKHKTEGMRFAAGILLNIVILAKEDLHKAILHLESNTSMEEAYFGIFSHGEDHETYIRANKKGLEVFARNILRVLHDEDVIHPEAEKKHFTVEYGDDCVDNNSTTFIHYIELTNEKKEKAKRVARRAMVISIIWDILIYIGFAVTVIASTMGLIRFVSWALD